ALASSHVPDSFNWILFAIGEALVLAGIWRVVARGGHGPLLLGLQVRGQIK
ncbi:hypothetical protein LCGC14_2084270, partial [marine sediment metagenome]